mgnify:CR=1 FL=1
MEIDQLNDLKANLLEGMREYMEDVVADGDDPGYSEDDIAKCESILTGFLQKATSVGVCDKEAVMNAVKETVLALNELNENCDHGLIETDQREQICELIIQAAAGAGVGTGDDITEEWREW